MQPGILDRQHVGISARLGVMRVPVSTRGHEGCTRHPIVAIPVHDHAVWAELGADHGVATRLAIDHEVEGDGLVTVGELDPPLGSSPNIVHIVWVIVRV